MDKTFTGKEIFRACQKFEDEIDINHNSRTYIREFGISKYLVELLSQIINKREDRMPKKPEKNDKDPVKNRSELMDL